MLDGISTTSRNQISAECVGVCINMFILCDMLMYLYLNHRHARKQNALVTPDHDKYGAPSTTSSSQGPAKSRQLLHPHAWARGLEA